MCTLPMSSACTSSSVERGPRTVTRISGGIAVTSSRFALSAGGSVTTLKARTRWASCDPWTNE
jgi:hypothetical protein